VKKGAFFIEVHKKNAEEHGNILKQQYEGPPKIRGGQKERNKEIKTKMKKE
jgi:hypothetical protein